MIGEHRMRLTNYTKNLMGTIMAMTTFSHFHVKNDEPSDMVQGDGHLNLVAMIPKPNIQFFSLVFTVECGVVTEII